MTTTITPNTTTTWTIDPAHTEVGFEVRHMMFAKVRGRFTDLEGTLRIAPAGEESSASVVIQAASIDTGQSDRDVHLRSADFFDVETFPELTFEGKGIRDTDGTLTLAGDLTIRDIARPVELEVEESGRGLDPWGKERVGFTATVKIDGEEFLIICPETGLEGGGILAEHLRIAVASHEFPIAGKKTASFGVRSKRWSMQRRCTLPQRRSPTTPAAGCQKRTSRCWLRSTARKTNPRQLDAAPVSPDDQ